MIGWILAWALSANTIQPLEWMENQVLQDLSLFQKGFSKADVNASHKKIMQSFQGESVPLVRCFKKQGTWSWQGPSKLSSKHQDRAKTFCKALSLLNDVQTLPDTEFLLWLDPTCERPVYLRLSTVPIFAIAKSKRNHVLARCPKGLFDENRMDVFKTVEDASQHCDWQKRRPVVLWRANVQENEYLYCDWEVDPAPRLLLLGRRHPDQLCFHIVKNAAFKKIPWWTQQLFTKLALVNEPLSFKAHVGFRYLLACSQMGLARNLEWQLHSGSPVLKGPIPLSEWFDTQLVPNKHYFPISLYGEDLVDRFEWLQENEGVAQDVAQKALQFAKNTLNDDTMFSYFYALIIAYSKLVTK